ncbi:uncharacterized J domain-containing protein C4G9.19 [Contarinia nasturtii]|uniref:uncharacterized J domain-containing protein C4G9.19 n=1 Tax=Contarinia nasturtii TaxID=265458 RepID=UPI0012D3ED57|nr:uncharacterized J domain-containing protein C4G9.19 [Contarinia nasturtii]
MEVFFITHPMLKQHAIKFLKDVRTLSQCRRFYSKRTHYDVLNLKKTCSNDEIRKSFASLSKKYHPDTSKDGNIKQNSTKFQEIMEAYKVLNKKSTRDAYDAEISITHNPYYAYHSPYNASSFRGAPPNDFNRGGWQHMEQGFYRYNRNGYSNNYYRDQYNNPWTPGNVFTRKKVWGFIVSFVLMNFLTCFLVYSLSRKNRLVRDFEAERKRYYYDARRHGHAGPTYYRVPEIKDENSLFPPDK